MKPLSGLRVLDFSQFLAGPACSLRLADLGAEVIKVERPGTGDICRQLYVAKQKVGDESTIFHAINRNKKSVALDLKNSVDKAKVCELVASADVVIQNFRPGVAKRLGIDFESLKKVKTDLVYGSVSGYGKSKGPWYTKPGQDLLAQAMSGLVWRNACDEQPMPMGLAIADLMAAYELTQGVLALLVRRGKTGVGGLAEVSLLESLISLQSTSLVGDLNEESIKRSDAKNINGVYATADGFIAIANCSFDKMRHFIERSDSFDALSFDTLNFNALSFSSVMKNYASDKWLADFLSYGIDAAVLINWHELRASEHYQMLNFEQTVYDRQDRSLRTTRCPINIDGKSYYSDKGAPSVGQDNDALLKSL